MAHSRPTGRNRQRDRLVQAHGALVSPIAARYALNSPEPLDDLMQVGMLGLLSAAERYRPSTNVPFASYARVHIRGAILHHLRDRAWLVRLPRRQSERLYQSTHHPSATSIDSQSRDCLERWSALVRPLCLEELQVTGLDAAVALGNAATSPAGAADRGYRPSALDPSWEPLTSESMLALLEPRQRRVLRCVVLQGLSYRRTGARLAISAPTVQRLLHQGLAELRACLAQRRFSAQSQPRQRRVPSAAEAW